MRQRVILMDEQVQKKSFHRCERHTLSVAVGWHGQQPEMRRVFLYISIAVCIGQLQLLQCDIRICILKIKQQICVKASEDQRCAAERQSDRLAVKVSYCFIQCFVKLPDLRSKQII